jgi:hypothetical protein
VLVGSPGDNASRHAEIGEGALGAPGPPSISYLGRRIPESARKGPLREQSGESCNLG